MHKIDVKTYMVRQNLCLSVGWFIPNHTQTLENITKSTCILKVIKDNGDWIRNWEQLMKRSHEKNNRQKQFESVTQNSKKKQTKMIIDIFRWRRCWCTATNNWYVLLLYFIPFLCFQVRSSLMFSLSLPLSLIHEHTLIHTINFQYCCRHIAAHPFRPPDRLLWLLVYLVSSIARKPPVIAG